ncbi:MAG TPA: TonB-dependent receptor [Bacteroidia bacterium]|nr:TonB-dependent receptor [Bacteroidia bacterium]
MCFVPRPFVPGISQLLIATAWLSFTGLQAQGDSLKVYSKDTMDLYSNIPVMHGSGDTDEENASQDIPPLLQNSRDVFVQFSAFQFSAARYRMRGYPAENQTILFNGSNVSNLETGYSSWNLWGGLNDISRYAENRFSNLLSPYAFTGPAGYVYIDSRASSFKKGTRLSFALSNRLFRSRSMITHSSGMMSNGWAFCFSASWRNGNEVYIPGTFYRSYALFFSADKRVNTRHLINLSAVSVSTEQGRASSAQADVYALSGTHFYNSCWGLQNGEVRNASVSFMQKPILILRHDYNGGAKGRMSSSLLYTFGQSGISALNWNEAPNPRPDYYRYLPAYYYSVGDSATADQIIKDWRSDVNVSQINWDRMIGMNRRNLYSLPNENLNTSETRAMYVLEQRVEKLSNLGLNTVYTKSLNKFQFTAGLNANLYNNHKFKRMDDLLGASYWLDYDQFADNLGVDNSYQQNNIEEPDKKIRAGDRFGYDYSIKINKTELWSQLETGTRRLDAYFGLNFSAQSIWREGYMANGKFPTKSKGKSEVLNFMNAGIKAGMTLKISGRQYLQLNGLIQSRAPEANSLFVSQKSRNDKVEGVQNEFLRSLEISYHIRYPGFSLRFTAYSTRVNHQTQIRTYWHDEYNTGVNLIMRGIDQSYSGLELGLEKTLFINHQIQAAAGLGQFIYCNRPELQAWQDNNNTLLYGTRSTYLNRYYCPGPQNVLGLNYRYTSARHWFAGLSVNYFDKIFVDLNPERRTREAIEKYLSDESVLYKAILEQEELPSYAVVNASAGKSWQWKRKYALNLNAMIYNLLNNTNIITSGSEQLRWDKNDIGKFPNKYTYMQGTGFLISLSLTFM